MTPLGLRARSGPAAAEEATSSGSSLAERYQQVRTATVALCAPLSVEDYVVQSMPDASPAKWHLAHTSWFFEEFVLQHAVADYRFHDDAFRFLFNSYYNAVGPMHSRPHRGLLSRPTVAQVLAYRSGIDERMGALLQNDSLPPEARKVVVLGLHHEQQHQELILTDLKHLLSCNPLLPAYISRPSQPSRAAPSLAFASFEGGVGEMGHAGEEFCFDNELPRHRTYVEPYQLANRLVTNSEYLEFVRSGGYSQPAHWLSDGWATVQREGWSRPLYWAPSLDAEFSLTGLRELNPHAPASHLSYYEADAFCHWAQARLPTEAEWELAAASASSQVDRASGNFVEDGHLHPHAAAHPAPGPRAATALGQMLGDVWEWTSSAYSPYPGFRVLEGALGEYNGKFMVNQLVLRGGSCATPRSHIRPTYRNFFNATARWQFSGLRLARNP